MLLHSLLRMAARGTMRGRCARLGSALARAPADPSLGGGSVGYVTDVEGDLEFWRGFVALSHVIEDPEPDDHSLLRLSLRPNCHLVFGGDAVDKRDGDLRFLRSLLGLRARHPDRVHLILGNRDINKMRLPAELSDRHWLPAAEHPGVYWRQGMSAGSWLAQQPTDSLRADTRANRLRYMLQDTMGSPRAFELRRSELQQLGGADGGECSDDDVLHSYERSLRPGGLMREYLQHARLAALVGPCLFVHGAVGADSLGVVPGLAASGGPPAGRLPLREWVDGLNAFAARQARRESLTPARPPARHRWLSYARALHAPQPLLSLCRSVPLRHSRILAVPSALWADRWPSGATTSTAPTGRPGRGRARAAARACLSGRAAS